MDSISNLKYLDEFFDYDGYGVNDFVGSIGYDNQKHMLFVDFFKGYNDNIIYGYYNVPYDVYDALRREYDKDYNDKSRSVGGLLNELVIHAKEGKNERYKTKVFTNEEIAARKY